MRETASSSRQVLALKKGWRFLRGDPVNAQHPQYDDSRWQRVRVPHDWAIAGPFSREHDLHKTAVIEDGDRRPEEQTGRTGGLPHAGVAWYRLSLKLPENAGRKRVFVEFDGAMSHSEVFWNAAPVGSWPYGYASFCFEVTDHVSPGKENLLAVRVDNKPFASRWYPGAGIYRNVRLVLKDPVHIAHWGTMVTTPQVDRDRAITRVRTLISNQTGTAAAVQLRTMVLAPDGTEVVGGAAEKTVVSNDEFDQKMTIPHPTLWDIDQPHLYTVVSILSRNGREVERQATPFGIRTLRFDPDQGFFLNGRQRKLKGVCLHHDLGPLGTAVNRRAIERQLEILADMGCNAIRTSHNPPAPELLDLCDTMGFLVMDEAFDEWRIGKVENGYHRLFEEWAEKDLRAMLRRDRNHPSIIMWSIGNETRDQKEKHGAATARFLTQICHEEDPTRPVTAAFHQPEAAIANGLAQAVDIPGWNYKPHLYSDLHRDHPDWIMVASETVSCVSSRGEYFFPALEDRDRKHSNLQCSSYDMSANRWSNTPDRELNAQEDCPFMLGEFVWTGFDYLGEPTPYKTEWPSRSSYFGIVDLCGLPKDRFYLYRSAWSSQPTLHLLPHWNWTERRGQITPVHCYTNYPSGELFVNGQSYGRKHRDATGVYTRRRLIWDDVVYEPGALRVVAYDDEGKPAAEKTLRTAGHPAAIALQTDRKRLAADDEDRAFVRVCVQDKKGTICPHADMRIDFQIQGAAEIVAVGNGDPTSLAPFQASCRHAFHGMCMVIVQPSPGQTSPAVVRAEATGLEPAETTLYIGCGQPRTTEMR